MWNEDSCSALVVEYSDDHVGSCSNVLHLNRKGPISTENVQPPWVGFASVSIQLPGHVIGTPLFFFLPLLLCTLFFRVTLLADMVSELTQPKDSGPDTF